MEAYNFLNHPLTLLDSEVRSFVLAVDPLDPDRVLVRILPGSADDLRDRGLLYAALDCYGLAARDLESYLALAPGAKDAEDLAARAALLRLKASRLN